MTRRRSWATGAGAAAGAVALAAGLSACSSGPAALAVHCTGHTFTTPDTSSASQDGSELGAPATDIPGPPHLAATIPAASLDGQNGPADSRYGYALRGWNVAWVPMDGGKAVWSTAIHLPGRTQPSRETAMNLQPYTGYAVVAGGTQGQDIAAVSAKGKEGPACALPPFAATDRTVALLPNAGVVILGNAADSGGSTNDFWLDGYSTATSQRLWSVDSHDAAEDDDADFIVSGDTMYVWQDRTGDVAAYNARTGQRIWLTDSGTNSPLYQDNGLLGVSDGYVFAMADEVGSSRILALNRSDGKIAWKREVPTQDGSGEVAVNQAGKSLIAIAGEGLHEDYLVKAANGDLVSSLKVKTDIDSDMQLCYPGGHLAVAIDENGTLGVLSSDPADNRSIPIPSGVVTAVTVTDTLAYVQADQARAPVEGYDLATGKLLWRLPARVTGASPGVIALDGGFAVEEGTTAQIFR